jgi:hypothetical protein
LISEFCRLTSVPLVLNTSFNENELVVCRPEEALDCLLRAKWTSLSSGIFISRGVADTMEVRSVEANFSALNAADVKYLVVDGLAVNAYEYERLTRDVAFGTRPQNLADIAELEKIEKLKQSASK